jgi:hypothetical protein
MPITLNEKIADVTFDGLISDTQPAALTRARTIRKGAAAATYVRGTIMAVSSGSAGDGKLVILGTTAETNETLTPDCILCDDVEVGTSADVKTVAYISGCFDPDKVTVKESYDITAADLDAMRVRNILFKAVQDR